MGSRTGHGPAEPPGSEPDGAGLEDRDCGPGAAYSGSEQDSDSGEEEDAGSGGERRGVKRERDRGAPARGSGGLGGGTRSPGGSGVKPGKKTRGRVKIKMEFIDNKLRRYTTFSKRKTGIMKKAYELSTLTGTQVLLLVASETGHVYTFATRKLQPMITSETGKALIQTCLNSPDSPPRADPSSDQRMSATGFEETDLSYQVAEAEGPEGPKDPVKPPSACRGPRPPPPSWQPGPSPNGALLKGPGVVLPGGLTLMSGGGASQQLQAIQLQPGQPASSNQSPELLSPASSAASLPVSIFTSSSSSSGHMVYPGSHALMYAAPPPSLGDAALTVLNAFPPGPAQSHDPGGVPQVFLTPLPPGASQIPVSTVQLHPMVISQQSSSLTELQVVSLDVHQSKED
ncbi:LOW QUALITY PROTEIN: serum response factor-like [Menidia menidia]